MLFLTLLAGTAILIFLLSLLQYGIEADISKDASNAGEDQQSPSKQDKNINETGHGPVADAIHAYRRGRETDEQARAKRERVTIIALVAAAVFALFAAVAAGISAWFLYGQLGEMHQASIDTGNLVKTARDTERRQLRAYIGIPDGRLRCASCDKIRWGILKYPAKGYKNSDMMLLTIQNSGKTPAYDVAVTINSKEMPFGKQLPPDFKYPDYPSIPDLPPMSHTMSNPGQKDEGGLLLNQEYIMEFVRAQNNECTLYLYGHADYIDIFGRRKSRDILR